MGATTGKNDRVFLEERAKRCVCKSCGGELKPSLVIYDIFGGAGVELVCPKCDKKEFGIEPEIYKYAEYYVQNFQFNYFYDMEENELNEQMNISKVADMMAWLLKKLGLLDNNGLKQEIPQYDNYKKFH